MTTEGKELPVEETPVTPTAEDPGKMLQAQIEDLKGQLVTAQKSYKGLQQTLNKTNEEKQRLANMGERMDNLEVTIKTLGSMLMEQGKVEDSPENMSQDKKQERLNQWTQLQKQQDDKRKADEAKRQYEEFKQKAETVYQEAETLYGDNVEKLATVRNLIRQGDFDLIDKMISKDKPKTAPTTEKETEDERINRMVEEKLTAKLAEAAKNNPLLKTEPASPSGRNLTEAKVRAQYAAGDITSQEYAQKKKELNF